MGPEAAEIITEKEDFSDPELYLEVFQKCLENEETKEISNTDLLTILSMYSQAMKFEISQLLDEDTKLEIDSFINFSLQEKFKGREPKTEEEKERIEEYTKNIIEKLEDL
jgi:nucleoid DNA-binding protein